MTHMTVIAEWFHSCWLSDNNPSNRLRKWNFHIFSLINSKHVPSYKALYSDSFGVRNKVIGQIEQEMWLFEEYIIYIDDIQWKLSNLASFNMQYLKE